MSIRVLVVDDHPEILRLLATVLRAAAYDVVTATTGDEALAQWRAADPDIVLLDLNLPGMLGSEVCRQIKAASTTPVILMSGQITTEGHASQLAPAADAYLIKPFDVADILTQIPILLAQAPGREAAARTAQVNAAPVWDG